MALKIDVDFKSFRNWLKHFNKTYTQLRYAGVKVECGEVYKTKHGYHIYLSQDNVLSKNEIIAIELILGDDRMRGAYSFVEGNDILFKEKNGVKEKFSVMLTHELNTSIYKINSQRFKRVVRVLYES